MSAKTRTAKKACPGGHEVHETVIHIPDCSQIGISQEILYKLNGCGLDS
jgi:hypothetical protein